MCRGRQHGWRPLSRILLVPVGCCTCSHASNRGTLLDTYLIIKPVQLPHPMGTESLRGLGVQLCKTQKRLLSWCVLQG